MQISVVKKLSLSIATSLILMQSFIGFSSNLAGAKIVSISGRQMGERLLDLYKN